MTLTYNRTTLQIFFQTVFSSTSESGHYQKNQSTVHHSIVRFWWNCILTLWTFYTNHSQLPVKNFRRRTKQFTIRSIWWQQWITVNIQEKKKSTSMLSMKCMLSLKIFKRMKSKLSNNVLNIKIKFSKKQNS